MNRSLKPVIWIVAVTVALAVVVVGRKLLEPKELVAWRGDLAAARAEAAAAGRPVLAYFTAEWCGPCNLLKRTTWADAGVDAAVRERYVPVKIDVDRHPDLAMAYQVEAMPTFAVLDADGRVAKGTAGYLGPDEFLA